MRIRIMHPIAVENIECILLPIFRLHRYNSTSRPEFLFIMSRLLLWHSYRSKRPQKSTRHRSQCRTKDSHQDATRESWP